MDILHFVIIQIYLVVSLWDILSYEGMSQRDKGIYLRVRLELVRISVLHAEIRKGNRSITLSNDDFDDGLFYSMTRTKPFLLKLFQSCITKKTWIETLFLFCFETLRGFCVEFCRKCKLPFTWLVSKAQLIIDKKFLFFFFF